MACVPESPHLGVHWAGRTQGAAQGLSVSASLLHSPSVQHAVTLILVSPCSLLPICREGAQSSKLQNFISELTLLGASHPPLGLEQLPFGNAFAFYFMIMCGCWTTHGCVQGSLLAFTW